MGARSTAVESRHSTWTRATIVSYELIVCKSHRALTCSRHLSLKLVSVQRFINLINKIPNYSKKLPRSVKCKGSKKTSQETHW